MALDFAQVSMSASWQQTKINPGFTNTVQGPDSTALFSTLTVGTSNANSVYNAQAVLAASGTATIDLQSFTDQIGQAIVMTRAYAIIVTTTGASLKVEPNSTNGLSWFFGGTTPSITIPDGGGFCFSQSSAQTVSGTSKQIKLTNTGAVSTTYKITIIGGP